MSQYSVSTVRMNLQARAAAVAAGLLEANRACIDSLSLGSINAPLHIQSGVESLTARWQLLGSLQGGDEVLKSVSAASYTSARRHTEQARVAQHLGNTALAESHARAADSALRQSISQSVGVLRVDERRLTSDLATRALTGLGYQVEVASGDRAVGLWAKKDHHVMAVLVQDGGAMEIDNAGVLGAGCTAPMEEFQRALSDMGADAEVVRRVMHGDDGGGHLISRACQADAGRPAEGLVQQFEIGVDNPQQMPQTPQVARPSQTLGEAS